MLTNQASLSDDMMRSLAMAVRGQWGERMADEAVRMAITVAPEYLEATFDEIDARCGSVQRYLEDVLNLSSRSIELIVDAHVE